MNTVCRNLAVAVALTGASHVAFGQQAADTLRFPAQDATPSLNFYGLPGLIDMPSAETLPDGQLVTAVSYFGKSTRTTLSFQVTPRISASFRYVGLQDINLGGFETYRDRSFDARFLVATEGRYRPALTVGLQDLAGTGIYSGEYIVATKTFQNPLQLPGRLSVTAGLGWGRLGSSGDIGSPFSETRAVFTPDDEGGEPSIDSWFRGPAAPFAGIEWQINDRFGFKAEYSSDAYTLETSRGLFTRDSRLNFGLEYQASDAVRLGAYWLYGSEVGVSAQWQFNPKRAGTPKVVAGPRPIIQRPSPQKNPQAWTTAWVSPEATQTIRDALAPELEEDKLVLEAFATTASEAELRIGNPTYRNQSIAIGRAARAMARILPASVSTFRITPVVNGLAQSTVVIQRQALERLEFEPNAAGQLLAATSFEDATPRLNAAVRPDDLYPKFGWSLGPYISPSYFDPDRPVRADVGLSGTFRYRFAPGWLIAGEARLRLTGNIENGRLSNSDLPRVRTDGVLYAQETDTPIDQLYIARQWKPGKNTYARVTAGYLESMYGGLSAELLWKPQDSRLGLGVEANYAKQRDFDQKLGFRDYDIFTGHVSAYYDFENGYTGQVDVGRYLAGDVGATVTVTREFDNGWKVGGFFTLTDVSAEEFGEGSFDKGINLTIPLDWFLGRPTRQSVSTTVRPVQRDGGARLNVPGRLYDQVRDGHQSDIVATWSRVWE